MRAARSFNKMQALEKEVKELFASFTVSDTIAATASAATTTPIVYTKVALGPTKNTNTVTIQVVAAAANPTNTILAVWTGTAAATTITITPNDGTNNGAVAVNLTTANLVQLINTGAVTAKTVTKTDASSLRTLVTATGGDTTNLADGGEGDGVVATFTGGSQTAITTSKTGIASIARSATGEWTVTLDDKYYGGLKHAKLKILRATGADLRGQIKSETVTSTKIVVFFTLTGATATDLADGDKVFVQLDLKNSTV